MMEMLDMIEFQGGGASANQLPASDLAESNKVTCHPEGKFRRILESMKEILRFAQNDMKKSPCHLERERKNPKKSQGVFQLISNCRNSKTDLQKKAAFTMAEVLITLGIIGIVAAMTLPALINKSQQKILVQQFKKMYTNIQNTINLIQAENGAPFECYNTGFGGYHLTECEVFWDKFLSKYQVLQTCEKFDYDCRPRYKTKSQVLAEGGEILNDACSMNIDSYGVFNYLSDGSMLIIQRNAGVAHHSVFFAVDVNGAKGPNKWGYDLFYITLNRESMKTDVIVANEVCGMKEKGGMYINEILLK